MAKQSIEDRETYNSMRDRASMLREEGITRFLTQLEKENKARVRMNTERTGFTK